jgi:hypothetical protein
VSLGIHPEVYTTRDAESSSSTTTSANFVSPLTDSFISLFTYKTVPSENEIDSPFAFNACSNKEGILTQSQMFKEDDSHALFTYQRDEIVGLQKFDVVAVEHTSHLPPRAKLISSIWSYQHKRLPSGVLLKHNA